MLNVNVRHQVTILVDASAVTSVTKGFGWVGLPMNSGTTALDRAKLPEGKRITRAEQMGELFHSADHIIRY